MLPPVILHIVKSSHSESHSGGSTELPSNGFLRDFFLKESWFYGSLLPGPPPRAPHGAPPGRAAPLQGAPLRYRARRSATGRAVAPPESRSMGWLPCGWLWAGFLASGLLLA